MRTLLIVLLAVLITGCALESERKIGFEEGVEALSAMGGKYNMSLVSVPTGVKDINSSYEELLGYRASHSFDEDIALLIDYRIRMLEAKVKYEEGWKYGRQGTTEFGFGCRGIYDKVRESATLRNESAAIGTEAMDLLQRFLDTYPEKAKSLNLGQRDVLITKTIYFEIAQRAEKDYKTITLLCADKINKTSSSAHIPAIT